LARRDREVLRHVRRYECGGVVRHDNRSQVKGDPKGERRSEPHLPGLTSEWCRELRRIRLCCGDL
jgi:hypothetical protein